MGHARVETTAKVYVVAEQEGLARAVRNMRNRVVPAERGGRAEPA